MEGYERGYISDINKTLANYLANATPMGTNIKRNKFT